MENTSQNRRRNYYVDREFQARFIIKFCLLVILGAIISGVIIYSLSKGSLTSVFENSRLRIKSTQDFILPAVLWSSVIVIISIGLATIFMTLYASHKISGPLYRIAADLEKVMAGDFRMKFSLRTHDQLQALAANIDKTVSMMRGDLADLKNMVRELGSVLEESDKTRDLSKLKEAKNKLDVINQKLSKFRT